MDEKTIKRYQIVSKYMHNQTEEEWNDMVRRIADLEKFEVEIPFTQNDAEELVSAMDGEKVFEWTYETEKDVSIKLVIKKDEESEE